MEAVALERTNEIDEAQEEVVGSRNHSYLQSTLVAELFNLDQFAVYSELSLDINGKEYKPDIALYPPEQGVDNFLEDTLRMTELPLCAIEILSPRQFMESILDKFKVYFAAGISSCWLVIPHSRLILVHHDLTSPKPFAEGEVVDEKLNLRLPLARIFRQTGKRQMRIKG